MKKLAAVLVAMAIMVGGCGTGPVEPLGVRLQKAAGNSYEVIYNPSMGIYTVEPK